MVGSTPKRSEARDLQFHLVSSFSTCHRNRPIAFFFEVNQEEKATMTRYALRSLFLVACLAHCLSLESSESHRSSGRREAAGGHVPVQPSHALSSSGFLLREWRRVQNFSIVFNKIEKCSSSSAAGVMRTVGFHRNAYADTQMHLKQGGSLQATHLTSHEPFVLATHHAAGQWSRFRQKVSEEEEE